MFVLLNSKLLFDWFIYYPSKYNLKPKDIYHPNKQSVEDKRNCAMLPFSHPYKDAFRRFGYVHQHIYLKTLFGESAMYTNTFI